MKNNLKDLARRILYLVLCVSHSQGKKNNIVLFSTRRGGSTLFSQLITNSNKKMRYYDHLFSWYQTDFSSRKYFSVSKNNQEIFPNFNNKNYFELVNSGVHIARTICNPFSNDFVRKSNRILYKVTEAKGLFDWFFEKNDIYIIYQIRHPIATALSIMRLGWDLTISSYLNNEKFVKEYLGDDKYNYCIEIINSDNLLSKYVLNWVLENLIPLKSKNLNSVYIISYEEMLINPNKYFSVLKSYLDLDDYDGISSFLNTPSRSSSFSNQDTINDMKSSNINSLITKWKKNISDKEERKLMKILEKFELDIYRFGEFSINKNYLSNYDL